ncbi:filamentous hemagglutinin [Brevibacillus laterosporus]|uniref:filamentous hemagglutinin n=1 Tax=Brevibacillus laterosporus TaxID=1465 RepID=UPI003D1C7A0A
MASSVIRNYTVEIDTKNKKSIFNLYQHPVEVLTPRGWENIHDEFKEITEKASNPSYVMTKDEEKLYQEFQDLERNFHEHKIASTIILDTDDISNIRIVGRDRVPHVIDAEKRANLPFEREFAYVYGASDISGVIILPYDDYSDVYVVSDSDGDGVGELTYIKTKEETGGVRPYYEKADGKTYIYVNHFSGGGGTQADPYIVSNEEDLNNVRNNLSAWYLQDRDIVMGRYQTGSGFEPIGNGSNQFRGVYDGNGYSIKSLYINSNTDETGLFGASLSSTIQNVRLIDPNVISSKSRVGALVGYGYNTYIFNCNVIGGVVESKGGGECTGGLVGTLYGNDSYGGSSGIYYSYNYKCNVKSNGNIVGGILGQGYYSNRKYVYVYHCFSTGKVEDTTIAQNKTGHGGLIGYFTPDEEYATHCYWDIEKSGKESSSGGKGVIGLSTSKMKNKDSFINWDFANIWVINQDYNEGYPEHRQFIRYKLGKGTQAEPFIINTEFDLSQMRWFRNGYYFRFEDDVKMISHQTGEGFCPLGFALSGKGRDFNGYVDGNGRCVANLFIYRPTTSYVSLFGSTVGGWIKNLDIIDCNITGSGYTAGFAGDVKNTTISNCHVDTSTSCKITGRGQYTGGFVGLLNYGGVIEDCSVNAIVSATDYCGMFVGYMYGNGIIRRCYTTGKGEATGSYLGGFLGNSSSVKESIIEDCFTNAELNGVSVGGFVGYYSDGTIRRCVAYGRGYASSSLNGFINFQNTSYKPVLSNNLFDKESYKTSNGTGGAGKTTAEMKHPSIYADPSWDFTNVWVLSEKHNDGYPVLRKLLPLDLPVLGFCNEFGKYYTDNSGDILRYLDFGTLVASQTSMPKAVWLQNNADFPINNLQVQVDKSTVSAGMKVELSMSETPFIGTDEITFSGTFTKGSSAKLFVRISSDISVKTGGTFDLRAKASPV